MIGSLLGLLFRNGFISVYSFSGWIIPINSPLSNSQGEMNCRIDILHTNNNKDPPRDVKVNVKSEDDGRRHRQSADIILPGAKLTTTFLQ